MSGSESEDMDEQCLLNLQEFIETLEPQLQELETLTQVEEFVSNLESTDPNFHRYNFIDQMKDLLDAELTPMIDELLISKQNQEDNLAININESLLKSNEFRQISSFIINTVQSASEKVTGHLNSDTFDFSGPFHKYKSSSNDYFNASSSDCSTADGMEFMFMSPDKFKTLAKGIDPSKPIDQRLKALSVLQQVPQTDLVASDAWELTKDGLQQALNDENEEINSKALKFISRLFLTGSSHVIREYFLLLIEDLTDYFNDSTSHMINLNCGLDLGDRRNVLLLKKFRLLNDIQKELPTTWLRYSEKYVEEMIESLVNLLGVSPAKISSDRETVLMNPLHFLSLVDPQAIWFKKWMHGFYSRTYLISSISKHPSFLKRPIKSCIELYKKLHNFNKDNWNKLDPGNKIEMVFDYFDVLYLQFIHSINFLSRLMLYKQGRMILNFELPNGKTLDIDMLVVAFIDIIKLHPPTTSKSPYHSGNLIAESFHLLSTADVETVKSCLCFNNIYTSAMQAFQHGTSSSSLPLVIEMLANIAISTEGCKQLLIKRTVTEFENPISVIELIANVFMVEAPDHLSNLLQPMMVFIQNILKDSDAVILLSKYNIHKFLSNLLRKQKLETLNLLGKCKNSLNHSSPTSPRASSTGSSGSSGSTKKSPESIAYKKSLQIEKQIMETILCLNLTPKGVILFVECDAMETCAAYIHNRLLEKERTARNGYGIIMSQIASTSKGIDALLKSGRFKVLIDNYLKLFHNKFMFTFFRH